MSEKQAKRLRKMTPEVPEQKKTADKQKVLFNTIAVILIVVVAGLAGYSIWNETRPEVQTLADALLSQETDFDTAVAEWGLDTNIFTPDMPAEEASDYFTLENIAKMEEKELADYLAEREIPEDTPANVPSKDLSTAVMLKVNGITMTVEELRNFGLSEEITEETLWGESSEDIIAAYYTALMAQQQQAEAEGAEGEE